MTNDELRHGQEMPIQDLINALEVLKQRFPKATVTVEGDESAALSIKYNEQYNREIAPRFTRTHKTILDRACCALYESNAAIW